MKNRFNTLCRSLALLPCLALPVAAQTVNWNTTPVGPNSYLLASDGAAQDSSFTWQIGYFGNGFIPNDTNFDLWTTNWVALDSSNPIEFLGTHYVTSTLQGSNVPPAANGLQAYIFAYNDSSLIGQAGGEALLLKQDNFTFTAADFPLTYNIANDPGTTDDAFTVIWGRVNRDLSGGGAIVAGSNDGVFSFNPGTSFEVQTATWAVVPEPSSIALALLGAAGFMARRRRH